MCLRVYSCGFCISCAHVDAQVCMYVQGGQGTTSSVSPQLAPSLPLKQGFSLAWNLLVPASPEPQSQDYEHALLCQGCCCCFF